MSMANCLFAWKMGSVGVVFRKRFFNYCYSHHRYFSSSKLKYNKKGLLLGVYSDKPQHYVLTKSAEHYNSCTSGKLSDILQRLQLKIDKGTAKVFYDLSPEYLAVCVVGLGSCKREPDDLEELDVEKEAIRVAVGVGAGALQNAGVEEIHVENFDDPESVAEAVTLKLWSFDELKNEEKRKTKPKVSLYNDGNDDSDTQCSWHKGLVKAEAQNIARRLADCPSNLMTPTIFAENASQIFNNLSNVEVVIRNKSWIEKQGMNSFLCVSQGSSEPPVFLEIHYSGGPTNSKPVVLVGKGVTFDTGGINLKPTSGLTDMRGDKGGAACVVGTTFGAAKLKLPVNITTLIPLCENMPSSKAIKPGDVVRAMNGKTVRIDNTDAEGRLILADALWYAKNFSPRFILDVATLTGAIMVALGGEATGVFTNSNCLWKDLHAAGMYTGDRVWRMPLWKGYAKGLTDHNSVDISNVRKVSAAGACSAAAFLREFIPEPVEWFHLDMAGVMGPNEETPYLGKGMTGRPTRTLIQFLSTLPKN